MKERVTIKDVAAEAGVSTATISYVLNGKKKVSEETRQKILSVIDRLGFVPDLGARGLSVKNTRLIGVVVPQTEPGSQLMFHNSFYSELLGSIELAARQQGYHVIISATDVTEDYLNLIQERNLAGVIIVGIYQNKFLSNLRKLDVPVVMIDSYCPHNWFHMLQLDDEYCGYLATDYVIRMGHKKIALVTGYIKEEGVMKKRLDGHKRSLAEHGIPYHEDLIFETTVEYQSGIQLAKRIVKEGTDVSAVIACADVIALGLIKGFYEEGVKVPEEISVMGCDDLDICCISTPGLTTVKQPISGKGIRAVELLIENINCHDMEKVSEKLPIQLIERDSVKKLI